MSYHHLQLEKQNTERLLSSNKENEEFDDDTIPPDFRLCYQHLQATSVGEDDPSSNELCKCCALQIAKKPINMFDNNYKLAYLGPGYTLFFVFLKYAIAFLLIFFAVIGIYELATNAAGDYCEKDPNCYPGYAIVLSMYNKSNDPEAMSTQQWLNLALILLMIVLLQLLRREKRKTAAECDERDISASDYTILVENIPKEKHINHREELIRLFENLPPTSNGVPYKVTKVNLTYSLKELNELKELEKVAVERKTKAFIYRLKNGKLPDGVTEKSLEEEISAREKAIIVLEKQMNEGTQGNFTGVAFVSFLTEQMKQDLIGRYSISSFQRFRNAFKFLSPKGFNNTGLIIHGQRLYLSQASEPGDVYWANLHLGDKERYVRKLFGYIFSGILLYVCALMIYYLLIKQNELKNEEKGKVTDKNAELKVKAMTTLLAIVIVVINKVLAFIIPYVASFERNKTLTEDYSSTVFKLSLALFINSGFLTFFVTYVYVQNYSGDGGLFIATNSVFISNALLNPFFYTLNPEYWVARFKRWYYSRQDSQCTLTQGQANKAFENPRFPVQTTSAALINTLWFTCFYCSVLPIGILFSLLCFIYEYFVLKHMMIRRCSILNEMGDELAEEMTDLVELSLVWFAIGNFVFNSLFNLADPYALPSILVLVIGILHYFLPTNTINGFLFSIKSIDETINYEKACVDFDKDYDLENPATKDAAIFSRIETQQKNSL